MRPISIEMEGFTSFRERITIDFSTLGLFAITGPTGAGKTSIIDAMTYVLYGCTSRIGEKQIRELISQGMQRVKVLFDFSSNRKKYRISRTGKWTGKSLITEVRFGELNGEDWTMIADSVKDTKAAIEKVIGLDFDGFTKSVILPQGRFDEFLKGKSDERRKILSDLLNLDVYNRMMKRANLIAKEHQDQASFIEKQLKTDFVDATPENVESLSTQLSDLQPKLNSVDAQLEKLKQALPLAHALKQDRDELAKTDKELHALAPQETAAEHKLLGIRTRVEELKRQLADFDQQIASNQYDPQLHLKLSKDLQKMQVVVKLIAEIEALENALNAKNSDLARLDSDEKKLSMDLDQARTELNRAAKGLEKSRKELKSLQQLYRSPDAIKAEIESLKSLRNQQKRLSQSRETLKKSERELKKFETNLDMSHTQFKLAENRFVETRAELQLLERRHSAEMLRSALIAGERCPVCDQEVSTVPRVIRHEPLEKAREACGKAELGVRVLDKQTTDLRVSSATLQHQLESQKKDINEINESVHALTLRYEGFSGTTLNDDSEARFAQLKKELEECVRSNDARTRNHETKRNSESAAALLLKDKSHEKALLENDIAGMQERIATMRMEVTGPVDAEKLQAQVAAQEKARTERERLDGEQARHSSALSRNKDDLAPAQSAYDTLVASRKAKESSIALLQQRITENIDAIERGFLHLMKGEVARGLEEGGGLHSCVDLLSLIDQSIRDLESERTKLQTEIVRFQEKISTLKQKIKRTAELCEQLESHRRTYNEANTLAQSLHGDQFIAFIQQEAYRRLALDGSVHLKTLSSERYSFTVREEDFYVIDHWNADEPRPVNTLSGGESFLASLALALALAEGLSGMSSGHTKFALESLFLDEGFGTLDPETLETVVSGIEALSLSDRLIGIISHLPDLAERMLIRIVVRKSVNGSSIEVA